MKQEEPLTILVREAVQETLTGLGFDTSLPAQLQADMHYLRRMRQGSEDVSRIVRHSLLTLMLTTGLFLVWEAFKQAVSR